MLATRQLPGTGRRHRVEDVISHGIDVASATTAAAEQRLQRWWRVARVLWLRWFGRVPLRGMGLVAPMLLFLVIFYVLPMAYLGFYALRNPELRQELPRFVSALAADPSTVPGEPVFLALATDLAAAREVHDDARALRALRAQSPELWQIFRDTLANIPRAAMLGITNSPDAPGGAWKAWFTGFDPAWSDTSHWTVIRRVAAPATIHNLVWVFDAQLAPDGTIKARPAEQRFYLDVLVNTITIAVVVTVATLILAFPVALVLATARARYAGALLILVMLPFWTSLLVRTYAWVMLLQTGGALNSLASGLGLIEEPLRLMQTRTGVYLAMIHILLPFMVLPLYFTMRSLGVRTLQAAASLGASPWLAFRSVYLPRTLPGMATGCLMVFVTSIGYYVTPLIIGGPGDAIASMLAAVNVNDVGKWGLAAALCLLMLATTVAVLALFTRVAGVRQALELDR